MKQTLSVVLALALTLTLAACGQLPASSSAPAVPSSSSASESSSAPAAPEAPAKTGVALKVAALKGPTAMGMVKLMDDSAKGSAANDYTFTLAGSPDEIVGSIIKGDFDIAAVPTNLAATLYNKTQGKVRLAALNTLGVLYLVENGDTIHSVADLKGKTVYATGKGSTPEFALNYILAQNGLTPGKDLTVEYKTEHTELATLLAQGKADIALLPQPFVTSVLAQNDKLRVALDLTQEWGAVAKGASQLTMGCIVVQQKLLDEHPEALTAFLAEYKTSVGYVTDPANLDAAAALVVAQGIIAKEPLAKQALPQCGIVYLDGQEMKSAAAGFLQVLYTADPKSVGGTLPDDNLYYLAK